MIRGPSGAILGMAPYFGGSRHPIARNFAKLSLRGIAWSAGEPVDRFNGLAALGARVGD